MWANEVPHVPVGWRCKMSPEYGRPFLWKARAAREEEQRNTGGAGYRENNLEVIQFDENWGLAV